MITRIKKWIGAIPNRVRPSILHPPQPSPKPTPRDDKEIIFECAGQDINNVCLMIFRHSNWLGQNGIELEKFVSGWTQGGVVRYRFKTKKDALHFKMAWAGDENKN